LFETIAGVATGRGIAVGVELGALRGVVGSAVLVGVGNAVAGLCATCATCATVGSMVSVVVAVASGAVALAGGLGVEVDERCAEIGVDVKIGPDAREDIVVVVARRPSATARHATITMRPTQTRVSMMMRPLSDTCRNGFCFLCRSRKEEPRKMVTPKQINRTDGHAEARRCSRRARAAGLLSMSYIQSPAGFEMRIATMIPSIASRNREISFRWSMMNSITLYMCLRP